MSASDHRCYECTRCAKARYAAEGTISGFSRDARGFLWEAGYDPDGYPELAITLDQAIGEGAMEAAFDVMREHGLFPHTDLRAPVHHLRPPPSPPTRERAQPPTANDLERVFPMKAKDIKPGVVYGINSSKSYGTANPIVFLAPVDRDHLYQTTSSYSPEGTPAHVKARSGAKVGRGSMYSSPTIGYPAVVGRGEHVLDRLKAVTLADFEAATSSAQGADWWFTLVTVLGHIQGPYEEVRAAEDAERLARIEAQRADEEARERAFVRADGLVNALARHGVTVSPDERYHPSLLLLKFEEADKLLALLSASPDSSSEEG